VETRSYKEAEVRNHPVENRLAVLAIVLLCVVSCAKKQVPPPAEEVKVTAVDLGHGVNTAEQIDQPIDTFSATDTIWASVRTDNTPVGTRILARWVYTEGGTEQVVTETEHQTARPGTGYTSFFIANPSPWPVGKYELRIVTNGKVQETKAFSVRG
jgi:hypothetical protein